MIVKVRGGIRTSNKKRIEYYYVDEKNKRWEGRVCPCRLSQRPKKFKANSYNLGQPVLFGEKTPQFASPLRRCRKCGVDTHNYYRCDACQPHTQAAYYMEAMGGVAY